MEVRMANVMTYGLLSVSKELTWCVL